MTDESNGKGNPPCGEEIPFAIQLVLDKSPVRRKRPVKEKENPDKKNDS